MLISWDSQPLSVQILSFNAVFGIKLVRKWVGVPLLGVGTSWKSWICHCWRRKNKNAYQWQIHDSQEGGVPTYYLDDFCQNLHENEIDWIERGRPSSCIRRCLRSQPFNTVSSGQNVGRVNQYSTTEVFSWLLKGDHERPISDLSIFTSENVSRLEGARQLKIKQDMML